MTLFVPGTVSFTVEQAGGRGWSIVNRQGEAVYYVAERLDALRIAASWNAHKGFGIHDALMEELEQANDVDTRR